MIDIPFPWFDQAWQRWLALDQRRPHALLVCGARNIGAEAFSRFLAGSLLCERPSWLERPCGNCAACRWHADGNHPDFRLVVPEALEASAAAPANSEAAHPAEEGESTGSTDKSRRAPSRVIKIEQIRRLDAFFAVGTHRGGSRVVLVYPAESLTTDAANALLKTLEEPPPDTYFILVTSRLSEVLPTIRSRSARFECPTPDSDVAAAWLSAQGIADAKTALAEAGGAPLAVTLDADEDAFRRELVAGLAAGAPDAMGLAERCEKAGAERLCVWLLRWIADVILCKAVGEVRYHPAHVQAIGRVGRLAPAAAWFEYYRRVAKLRGVAEHPLNGRLFAEDLLIDYARLTAQSRS